MSHSRFKDLVAYRLSREISDQLREAALEWSSFDQWSLGIQVVRAADSVGANLAEALGRWHAPDQRRLLYIARGSLFELEHWVDTAAARGLLLGTDYEQRIAELARTLNGLIRARVPGA